MTWIAQLDGNGNLVPPPASIGQEFSPAFVAESMGWGDENVGWRVISDQEADSLLQPPCPGEYYYWDAENWVWVFNVTPDDIAREISQLKSNYYAARTSAQEANNLALQGLRSLWAVSGMYSAPNSPQILEISEAYQTKAGEIKQALAQVDIDQQIAVNARCVVIQQIPPTIIAPSNMQLPEVIPACTLCAVPMNLIKVWDVDNWECPICGRRIPVSSAIPISAPTNIEGQTCSCLTPVQDALNLLWAQFTAFKKKTQDSLSRINNAILDPDPLHVESIDSASEGSGYQVTNTLGGSHYFFRG